MGVYLPKDLADYLIIYLIVVVFDLLLFWLRLDHLVLNPVPTGSLQGTDLCHHGLGYKLLTL